MSFQYNTATSFSDETYLESFIEAVSWTLPSDVQRSLQHLQMLDTEGSKLMKRWRDTQDSCLHGVETALLAAYNRGGGDGDGDGEDGPPPPSLLLADVAADPSIPATPSDNINNSHNSNSNNNNSSATKKSPASSERKKACYKCRNKKVKCDGKQSFCLFKEEYYNNNHTTTAIMGSGGGGDDIAMATSSEYYSPPQKKYKISNHDTDGISGEQQQQQGDDDTTTKQSSTSVATAILPKLDITRPPTAAELRTALQLRNPHYVHQRQHITNMYLQLQQCSREKIHTANQLKSMIDMALGRLSRDMKKFEQDLGLPSTSSPSITGGGLGGRGGGENAIAMTTSAAINTTAGSVAELHATTTTAPSSSSTTTTKDLAAIQTTPNSPDWILAKIISYNKYTKMYVLSDEDMASNEIYTIPERQVRPLKGSERTKWTKGDSVYAVYPDTTSFYPATVNCTLNGLVMVHFNDDWDASGVIHEKAIPAHHVMKAP